MHVIWLHMQGKNGYTVYSVSHIFKNSHKEVVAIIIEAYALSPSFGSEACSIATVMIFYAWFLHLHIIIYKSDIDY